MHATMQTSCHCTSSHRLPPYQPHIYPKIRSHRAATTGSTGFISLLLNPPEGSPKPRLNTADRVGASFLLLSAKVYPQSHPIGSRQYASSLGHGVGTRRSCLSPHRGWRGSHSRKSPDTSLHQLHGAEETYLSNVTGKPRWRNAGRSGRRRGTGAKTSEGLCH